MKHIQREVSQKEKNRYHVINDISGIKKDGTDEPIRWAARKMQTERIALWTLGQERVGGAESSIKHIKNMQNRYPGGIRCVVRGAQPCSVTRWRGGMGWDGEEAQERGDMCIPVGDLC